MASTVLSCLDSALNDFELLLNAPTSDVFERLGFRMLKCRLSLLKTFVVCARKLGNDESLRSFMGRIEDTVRRNAEEIHPHCLHFRGPATRFHFDLAPNFRQEIISLEKEIDEWYITMSDFTRASSSLVTYEVLEIISSVLGNLEDFRNVRFEFLYYTVVEELEVLPEQLTFLKSLIHFASLRGVEPREDLLARAEAAAINVAYFLFKCRLDVDDEYDAESLEGMGSEISTLLQKIKLVDAQVYETYVKALSSSKLSKGILLAPTLDIDDNDGHIAMKNILDYVISNLWEKLQLNTFLVVSTKDQLQELYKGLKSLRTLLKQQPNNFDTKIKEDIGVVVCDALVLVFSHSQTNIKVDLQLQDLLERINIVLAAVGEKDDLQRLIFNFPRTNELGFLDFLLEKLTELTSSEVEPTAKNRVRTIQEELSSLRSFLVEIVELRNEQEELQTLWNCVLEVACRVECFLDHLGAGDLLDSLSASFDSIMEDIKHIKADVLKIFPDNEQEIGVKEVTKNYIQVPSQRTPSITNEVVGFQNEATEIRDRLTRGSQQLRIVAIVGMAGQGKTTLATKVFNDPFVLHHFCVRAWCSISQIVDKKKLFLDLLNQIDKSKCSSEMTEHDLAQNLWRSLKKRRYLIFLDDIWDITAWNSLEGSFPNDTVGSRIILTSRSHDVAPHHMLDQEQPYFLRQLNEEESMELLQRKLFQGNGWPPVSRDLGMQIAKNCMGLPLTIIIVAGLLATMEPDGWKKILDGFNLGLITSTDHCKNMLELSYKHLPYHLRPCFLYFGAFLEDKEVSVRRLLRLWIAEGFVRKDERKSREDVAEDYLNDLIGRSLIMVAQQRSIGGVKTCRIHDLLHDFCIQKAKDEHFLHVLKGYDEVVAFNEPSNLRRFCLHSEETHFKKLKLISPRARSLFFNYVKKPQSFLGEEELVDISFVAHTFKLLRVLDLDQSYLRRFPSEIELLVHLAFLAIHGFIKHIPSSIANLSNLETFIVDPMGRQVSLPDSLWNLQKLEYLWIRGDFPAGGGHLPIRNLDSSSILHKLDRFSGAIIPDLGSMERLMRKFPKIRKLKCTLLQFERDVENMDKFVVPEFLSRLQSLDMSHGYGNLWSTTFEFSLPSNLKKLALTFICLSWRNISIIGELPNLEVLKLRDMSFEGKRWEVKEGEFSKLRILKLDDVELVSWTACDDQFVYLEKLVLLRCFALKEMPSCLEYTPTLEMIEVTYCSDVVDNLVRQIEKEQLQFGNSSLKIIIQSLTKK